MSDSFEVRSSIRNYWVSFSNSFEQDFRAVYRTGDYIIIDRQVLKLHRQVDALLENYENVIRIEASETTKSYEGVIGFVELLIAGGFKRNNRLIAIGGGITQDVTAFIASILYRGVDWIFFPTTLLAQADSCIGSKTSINFRQYKNQLGNFYPPLSIYIDTHLLVSLQERDIRSGVGEMAHYFYVSGSEDVAYFERNYRQAIESRSNLPEIINKSLAIKKRYIEIDEFDRNERIVFNYGHTFGHAIESITSYRIPHGVAVAFGMDMANFISVKKGYITESLFAAGREVFRTIRAGYTISDISVGVLLAAMSKDKKNRDGQLGLILTKGWGKMFKDMTPADDQFISWLNEYMLLEQDNITYDT